MGNATRPGDILAGRYRLVVLLNERSGGRFWRAWDTVLARHVALHIISVEDERAVGLREAARRSATIHDPHLLRVLDTDTLDGICYVVNEWGEGVSLNNMVVGAPLTPRRAAWITSEVGEMIATAHAAGVAHGRLVPENVLVDKSGCVKVIGFAVDAALHGLPTGRESVDVTDLAGVLYTALTGRWPGVSGSGVPAAPAEHGRPLRPRQVRAGVPRVLDSLCDEVLSGNGQVRTHTTARAIVDTLVDYIGDPSAIAEAEAALARTNTSPGLPWIQEPIVALPPGIEAQVPPQDEVTPEAGALGETELFPAPSAEPGQEPEQEPEPRPGQGPAPAVPPADETQAAVPVFEDDDIEDLAWLAPGSERPPPPPPFEEPPARPLFAPDPPEGRAARTPRPLADDPSAGGGTGTGAGGGTGTYWPWGQEPADPAQVAPVDPEEPDDVPGRSWLRVAAILAACLLVLVAAVYAFNRGREGGGPLGGDEPEPDQTSAQASARVPVASADDFDPFGGDGAENPDSVGLAVDGDKATSWSTVTYKQNFGPGGLKTGVGLVLDLGRQRDVRTVRLQLVGNPTTVELRAAPGNEPPAELDGLDVVAQGTASGPELELSADEPFSTRYLVVWLTSLPSVGSEFRGGIADVVVRS